MLYSWTQSLHSAIFIVVAGLVRDCSSLFLFITDILDVLNKEGLLK